ncbi:hypothetical protein K8I85_03930 [bacterium]|nr:hypothetical protein [bacterium]
MGQLLLGFDRHSGFGMASARKALILAVSLLLGFPILATGDDWDLWDKWPSPASLSDPETVGHWGPRFWTPGVNPVDTTGSGALYGVHGALLYDSAEDETKVYMMRNEVLVYNADIEGEYELLDLNGSCADIQLPPNGHEVFCGGYVALADGKLLIVGGPYWQICTDPDTASATGVPVTDGPASLYDPSDSLAYNLGWLSTDDLPEESGGYIPGGNCANNPLNLNRYYPTLTTLPDGRILMAAGDFWNDCNSDSILGILGYEVTQQERWVIYDPAASAGSKWEVESPYGSFNRPYSGKMFSYPQVKMLPYGIFYGGNDTDDVIQQDNAISGIRWRTGTVRRRS